MSISSICEVLGISRQAYYQRRSRELERVNREEKILSSVRMVRRSHPRMGTRKILVKIRPMLMQEGIRIGRDQLFDLLRHQGLLVYRRRMGGERSEDKEVKVEEHMSRGPSSPSFCVNLFQDLTTPLPQSGPSFPSSPLPQAGWNLSSSPTLKALR